MGISRDAICSDRVGLLADSGSMEKELTVFGTCYLEDGKVKYRVSNDRREIYQFMVDASDDGVWPTPVESLTVRQLVPIGEEERVLYDVKRKLAKKLAEQYPARYFDVLRPLVDAPATNDAWPLLEALRDHLEGRFEADGLALYEMLVRECVKQKSLDQAHKQRAWAWLAKNRDQMADDIVIKERNHRTFYGFIVLSEDGALSTVYDLELERVVDKKIARESAGALCGPILHKTFWFKENRLLPKLRGRFDEWLRGVAGDVLKVLLPKLHALPSAVDAVAIDDTLPDTAQEALRWYRAVWRSQ